MQKKKYNKPVCLDNCIINNIVGMDEGKNDFDKSYNKDTLIKYIKHHGYLLSDYNLFEFLRQDNWNDSNVIKHLLNINARTHEKIIAKYPKYASFRDKGPSEHNRDLFLKRINKYISEFASSYFSRLLIFPYLFEIYSIVRTFDV
ncbi:MAG: hypothetical protein IJS68_03010, partial [Clostridia bacterium]|nr:hypothetical protein [Clostridia bacterium]